MDTTLTLDGHTIEIRGSGSGSLDPWTSDFAKEIDCSLMCTSDMADFILIDGDNIYKLRSFNDGRELYEIIQNGVIDSWDIFLNEWLNPQVEKKHIRDFGSLKQSKEDIKYLKKKDMVWKSIPESQRRGVYKYLKTLSKEDNKKWFEDKFKELGI